METSSKEAVETNPKILSSLMLIILFVSMGQSVYWQTMPIIGREFQFTEIEINTLVSISAAMFIIFTPFWGKLSDRIGRKAVLLIGLTGYVLSNVLFLYSASLGLIGTFTGFSLLMILLAARIVNSAIGAASRPASGAYVADVTSEEDRSSGMGKFGAANNIGTILGPVLVGSLVGLNIFDIQIPQFGLLTPLIVMSFVMALAALFVYIFLPNSEFITETESKSSNLEFDNNLKLLLSIGITIFTAFALVQSVTAFTFKIDLNMIWMKQLKAPLFSLGLWRLWRLSLNLLLFRDIREAL